MTATYFGFLSKTDTLALSDPRILVWRSFPRSDGDAVFCRRLDDTHGGFFSTVSDADFSAIQHEVGDPPPGRAWARHPPRGSRSGPLASGGDCRHRFPRF